tara:strand:- start:3741 stop:4457 length:717 start_codon:yes stop_codon:yes gene_type:complete
MKNQYDFIAEILTSVKEFRAAVGFGKQDNAVHEQLYASESIELLTADSHAEKADALADMAVVMAGHYLDGKPFYDFPKALLGLEKQAVLNGVNLLEAFKIVMASNMSKVCHDDDIVSTEKKYWNENVCLAWKNTSSDLWACYSANDYPDKPKGKLLKPVTYRAPDWSGDAWKLDNNEHWNKPESLPVEKTPIIVKLLNGSTMKAIRPEQVATRKGDLGYFSLEGMSICKESIIGWAYE